MKFPSPLSSLIFGGRPLPSAGILLSLLASLGAEGALAADTVPTPGISFSTMLQTFTGLALILALFFGAALLIRRLNGGHGLMSGTGPMRVIANLPVGPRERIVLIEIEDTWLVVGVTPAEVSTLHTLPKGTLPPAGAAENQFTHWLRQFKESSSNAKN